MPKFLFKMKNSSITLDLKELDVNRIKETKEVEVSWENGRDTLLYLNLEDIVMICEKKQR